MASSRQPEGERAVSRVRRAALLPGLAALAAAGLAWAGTGTAYGESQPAPGDPAEPGSGRPESSVEVTVESGPDGVTIYIESETLTPGSPGLPGGPGGPGAPGSGDPPDCTAAPVNVGDTSADWVTEGLEANPGTFPWAATCDNGYFAIVWVPTGEGAPDVVVGEPPIPPVDPELVRRSALRIVGLPPVSVGASPGTGLVAMESWFWVRGYAGGTLRGSASLDRSDVDVEITPASYRWSFGDGSSLDAGSTGRAYPARSDIRHTYARSSYQAGGTYPVRLQITWSARYSENGGPWLPLDPITRTYALPYPVQQLQSVLTADR